MGSAAQRLYSTGTIFLHFIYFYIFLYFLYFYIFYIFIFLHFLHFLHFGNDMADVCGIIADIKREGEGEYIIPTSPFLVSTRRRKDSWSHMDSRYLTATPGWMELRSPDLLPSR